MAEKRKIRIGRLVTLGEVAAELAVCIGKLGAVVYRWWMLAAWLRSSQRYASA